MGGPETIVAAAVSRNGIIYSSPPPARHHTLMHLLDVNHGTGHDPFRPDEQGFLTSEGRFVGRRAAAGIAISAEQILETKFGAELFSEDLW